MKLVEIDSPEGRKLHTVYLDAIPTVTHLLMTGAPGQRLEDRALSVSGVATPTGEYVCSKVELIDLAAMVAAFPQAGSTLVASIPEGHMLVRILTEDLVMVVFLPIPARVFEARRLFATFPEEARPFDPRPTPRGTPRKAGRNEPCPCGGGRKFKHCCAN